MIQSELVQKRVTYIQDWSSYDKAQTRQKELFMKLLFNLSRIIPEEPKRIGKGRPKLPIREVIFASALKVFTTYSLRRFMTDIRYSKDLGYITHVPHFSMVSYYMEKEELTPILKELIDTSSLPLRSVESSFAVDSTGFRTTKFNDYCREKHKLNKRHKWIKTHLCCGVKTNIVTAVEISVEHAGDSPYLDPLLTSTNENGFKLNEVSADKAYSSQYNMERIGELGAIPFIPYKSNTRIPEGGNMWSTMYNFFTYRREDFMKHYHKRSNIESTNNMIKTKFTDLVRSKNKTAQINEVLLKVLCHNICVLIQEMFELGIEPSFNMVV